MLDVDRRSFVAGIGISTLPVPALATQQASQQRPDIPKYLEDGLNLSVSTSAAMASRARCFTGDFATILAGSSDGIHVEHANNPARHGRWLLRGETLSDTLLANAMAFVCPIAQAQLERASASFRWYSGCSFGGATAHLFRGSKSALFLVTRTPPKGFQAKRLDIVLG
jgi:hypothetical protein